MKKFVLEKTPVSGQVSSHGWNYFRWNECDLQGALLSKCALLTHLSITNSACNFEIRLLHLITSIEFGKGNISNHLYNHQQIDA